MTDRSAPESRVVDALSFVLLAAVDRWHETCPNEERSLQEWLEIPEAVWPDYVMHDVTPEVIAALADAYALELSTEAAQTFASSAQTGHSGVSGLWSRRRPPAGEQP